MTTAIYDWMKNLALYFILLTAVQNLIPHASYRRYIRFFMGLLLILLLLDPLFRLFSLKDELSAAISGNQLKEALRELENSAKMGTVLQDDVLIAAYEEEIARQITTQLAAQQIKAADVQAEIKKDSTEKSFHLQHITIRAEAGAGSSGQVRERIINMLTEAYGLSATQLYISIQEQ